MGPDHQGVSKPYPGRPRHTRHAPVVPKVDGSTPGWVIVCLDCPDFAHDAHGLTAEDAVKAFAPRHQRGHRLTAQSVNYDEGWVIPGRPLQGIPASTGGHGLYHA